MATIHGTRHTFPAKSMIPPLFGSLPGSLICCDTKIQHSSGNKISISAYFRHVGWWRTQVLQNQYGVQAWITASHRTSRIKNTLTKQGNRSSLAQMFIDFVKLDMTNKLQRDLTHHLTLIFRTTWCLFHLPKGNCNNTALAQSFNSTLPRISQDAWPFDCHLVGPTQTYLWFLFKELNCDKCADATSASERLGTSADCK